MLILNGLNLWNVQQKIYEKSNVFTYFVMSFAITVIYIMYDNAKFD